MRARMLWSAAVWSCALSAALLGCKKKAEEATPAPTPEAAKVTETKPAEPPKPPEKKPLTGEEIGALYKECMAAFSAHDEAKFVSTCFTDATSSDFADSGMPPLTGGKAIAERAKLFWTGFPDVKVVPQLILVSGNKVASLDLMTGTNTGSFMDQPATGKKIGFYMVHWGEIDQATGKTAKINGLMDLATMMGQLTGDKRARKVEEQGWPDAGKVVVAKDDATENNNVAVWNKGVEAWNAHDAKAFADYADDAVVHDVPAVDMKGKKAITDGMKGYWAGFSDLKVSNESVWGAGDWLVATGSVAGTNDGNVPAIKLKKTGKPVTLRTVEFVRLDAGKIKDHWVFYNGMAMAQQLGLMPPPPAAAPKK